MRTLHAAGSQAIGLDVNHSAFTHRVGSVADRSFVKKCMPGVHAVLHTATLHKPHIATHTRQDFVDTNVTGTLNLLEEAAAAGVGAFIFTSTTSVFGRALVPQVGEPAAWITEDVVPLPKNIYGVTKAAAENLCELFHNIRGLPCLILRTSRFFPEPDDSRAFTRDDLPEVRANADGVVRRRVPRYQEVYACRGWSMFPGIDRIYINDRARRDLDWRPRYDFAHIIDLLHAGEDPRSSLARAVGSKGYHAHAFADGPYPLE